MKVNMKRAEGIISWGGKFYCFIEYKRGTRFFESNNVRFDDTCGGTLEVSRDYYDKQARKYYDVFA